jgi:hypothetical protein
MATKILKMRSGEEVIARTTEKFEGDKVVAYTLKNPCMLVPMPGRGNQGPSLAIVPWMASVKQDQGFDIPKDAVLFTAEPLDELANEFNSAFGSGLVVPTKDMAVPSLKLTT